MEISEIQKAKSAKSVGQVQKNGKVAQTKIVDSLSISTESEKKAMWVEMLKEMPDVRNEQVEKARSSSPSNLELAHAIILNS